MYTMRPTQDEIMLHHQKVMNFLNNDRKGEKRFCNKTVCSQGQNFAIHDAVVGSMSDYFCALLGGEMREKYADIIELNKMSPKRLESLIDYIYTGDIEITEANVFDILEDADYTQMSDLKCYCTQVILHIISSDNCLKIRAHARRYNLGDVETKANQTIVNNFAAVVQSKDFMLLDTGDIADILKQRSSKTEEAVFTGLIQWVNFNPSLREELFVNLFSQLDLTSVSMSFLRNTIRNERLVRSNVDCSNAVMDALSMKYDACGTSSHSTTNKPGFLVIGGYGSERKCVKYDAITKQHENLPDLNSSRTYSAVAVVGHKVYVMGGQGETTSFEMLNLEENKHWKEMDDMNEPSFRAASTVVQDQIYVSGGRKGAGALTLCSFYDVNEDRWEKGFEMLQARSGHGMCSTEYAIYCVGGYDGKQRPTSCERYDIRSKTSSKIASLNEARSSLACVEMGGAIYAVGGWAGGNNYLKTVEKYDPRADRWEYISPLMKARSGHSACVLNDRIFVLTGGTFLEKFRSVEVYDPTSNTWTHCFDLNKPVFGAIAVAV